jgi:hypothetical protein
MFVTILVTKSQREIVNSAGWSLTRASPIEPRYCRTYALALPFSSPTLGLRGTSSDHHFDCACGAAALVSAAQASNGGLTMNEGLRMFLTGLVACFAAYLTFEAIPAFYGHRWVPALTIAGWWFAFEGAIHYGRKWLVEQGLIAPKL